MRNMSFAKTTPQIMNKTKTVTRRMGWRFLTEGQIVQAVEKCQGLKKGEKIKPLDIIRITSVNRERLDNISETEVIAEGFPHMTPQEFIDFFCEFNKCQPFDEVTRIEFEYSFYHCDLKASKEKTEVVEREKDEVKK